MRSNETFKQQIELWKVLDSTIPSYF